MCFPLPTIAMIRLHYLIPAFFATAAFAGEMTLEEKPFHIVQEFTATALPVDATPIRLDPEGWSGFKIASLAEHGMTVSEGDSLVAFESDEIDKKLTEARRAVEVKELELAAAQLALSGLEKGLPEKLERLERDADLAAEELAYFIGTRRKAEEESADQSLKRQEQNLASVREELKQLLQMYQADDITEDTEEIILKNQQNQVAYQEFALRMQVLKTQRTIEVSLPREEISLTERRDDSALRLADGREELPRALAMKKLEVEGIETSLAELRRSLGEMEQDRGRFEIKAPADGMFYHGAIEEGKWMTGDLLKSVVAGGMAPVGKAFATFIPSSPEMGGVAFLKQETAAALAKAKVGTGALVGWEDQSFPVELTKVSQTPETDGTYLTTFSAAWPEGISLAPGQALVIRVVSYTAEKAIVVPTKALSFGPEGWTVKVKLADGKNEARPVTRGKDDGERTEITAGLEVGQVVMVP